MHLSINITSITYNGVGAIAYVADTVRSDNPSNFNTAGGNINIDFETDSVEKAYSLLADDAYSLYCATYSVSQDPVTYMFLGLSIIGPFKYNLEFKINK